MIPVYGDDISTAQTLSEVAVTLTSDVLLPVSDTIGGVQLGSLIQDGRINLELLQELTDMLLIYIPLIDEQLEIINNLPDAHIDKLQSILDKMQDPIAEYRPMIELAEQYLPLLQPMLGANGETRTYLVIAMGNSELRSAGGFPGAWGTIEVTDGEFDLGSFTTIVHESGLSVEMLDGEDIYNLGIFSTPASATAMPNFNRTGEVASSYWQQYSGQMVDGVVAMDPVALQYLIGLTGEFDTSDGTHIDGSNASYEILHNVYVRYRDDGDAQDAFFAEVAAKAASVFFANIGNAKPSELIKTIQRLGRERRIQVWMADDAEEEMISFFGFGGEYSHDPNKPVVGIYLNDRTYSKIDWFMKVDVFVSEPSINADGTSVYDVTFVLTNTLSYDIAESMPRYVTGVNQTEKRDVTDMITGIVVSLPQDAVLESFTPDPEQDYWTGWVEGIEVIKTDSYDLGGTSSTFHLRITVPAGAEPLTVHVTPLAQEENLTITYEYL